VPTVTSNATLSQRQSMVREALSQRPQSRISAIFFALLLFGAFLSYAESGTGIVKLIAYSLTAVALGALLLVWRPVGRQRVLLAFLFSTAFALFSALTILRAEFSYSQGNTSLLVLLQELSYPAVTLFLVLLGFRLIYSDRTLLIRIILILAMANFLVAVLGILGFVTYVPLFGDVHTGRYIFFTGIASSNGLMFNVNYYATTQATLFFFYGVIQSLTKDSLSRKDYFVLFLLFCSTFLGSSRGVSVAIMGALIVIYFIALLFERNPGMKRVFLFLLLVTAGVLIVVLDFRSLYYEYYDTLYTGLRLGRGLNLRDTIWSSGIELWLQRPFLGWGAANASLLTGIESGLGDRSLHSGYVYSLVRGGLIGLFVSFGFVFFCVLWGLGLNKRSWFEYRWAVAAVSFYLISTATRTYSIGGLGLLPLLLGIAMSLCFYARSPLARNRLGPSGH
jgi:O-antigen ligase